jgi:hypothetical protein
LLPLTQIPTLSASNIKDQETFGVRWAVSIATTFLRSGSIVLAGRKLLNYCTFDPIVEAPQTLDATVRLAPVSTAFRNGVVVLAYGIMNPIRNSSLLNLLLAFNLSQSDMFAFCICDSRSLARTFLLSRLR